MCKWLFRNSLFGAVVLLVFSGKICAQQGARKPLMPILLPDSTLRIDLANYIGPGTWIDSVDNPFLDSPFEENILTIPPQQMPPLLPVRVYHNGAYSDLLFRRNLQRPYTLRFQASSGLRQVFVTGDFNQWNPTAHPLRLEKNGQWTAELKLAPGKYAYQLVADGNWMLDPGNSKRVSNGMGGENSVLEIALPDPAKTPFISSLGFEEGQLILGSYQDPETVLVFWQNHCISGPPASNTLKAESSEPLASELRIDIPEEAKTYPRSFIRAYAYNHSGAGNDLLIPLEYGIPLLDPAKLERSDWERTILYFTLVDRFYNGNPRNDQPLQDSRLTIKENYQGGDLAGIRTKIGDRYFQDLGANALWISPIPQNPLGAYQEYPAPRRWYSGYHGYWPVRSTQVDHRFGTAEEFKGLVSDAHRADMAILLDFVSHHVHQEHPVIQAHPEWKTKLMLPDGRQNLRLWDEQRLTTWFDDFLPSLDFDNPEVRRFQQDSAMFWIDQFGLDGFRHDATKHVPNSFWLGLTAQLRAQNLERRRESYQIGETFGSRDLIASYLGSDKLDGQFDFNLYFDARDVFALPGQPLQRLGNSLLESFQYYGHHHLMGNITGNHDLVRFMGLAGGGVRPDEDPKEAGYQRKIEVIDSSAYDRLERLFAFNASIPGVPVINYGDEIGMPGAGDPDNRRMMRFEELTDRERALKSAVSKIHQWRSAHMSMLYGDTYILLNEKQQLAYLRSYCGEISLVIFCDPQLREIHIPLPEWLPLQHIRSFESLHNTRPQGKKDYGRWTLSGKGYEFITLKK